MKTFSSVFDKMVNSYNKEKEGLNLKRNGKNVELSTISLIGYAAGAILALYLSLKLNYTDPYYIANGGIISGLLIVIYAIFATIQSWNYVIFYCLIYGIWYASTGYIGNSTLNCSN